MLAPLRLKITRHKKDFKKVLRPWIVNNTVLEPTFKHYSQIWRHVIDAKDVQCFILKVFTDAGRPFVWLRTAVPEVVVLSIPSSSLILCPHMKQAWFPWQRYPYHSCTTSAEGDHYHALVQCSSLRSDTGNKKNQKLELFLFSFWEAVYMKQHKQLSDSPEYISAAIAFPGLLAPRFLQNKGWSREEGWRGSDATCRHSLPLLVSTRPHCNAVTETAPELRHMLLSHSLSFQEQYRNRLICIM